MQLDQWARQWAVPAEALADLRQRLVGQDAPPPPHAIGKSEAWAQSAVRIEAAARGMRLWRNNVGALLDARGVPVRFGLCNESKEVNERFKSGDLIGIRPIVVTPALVGCTIGQFVSREIKEPGWTYQGNAHEQAQLAWARLVASLGGDAGFATGRGSL